jgi:hypothetical protein
MWWRYHNFDNPFYLQLTRNWEDAPTELSWLSMSLVFGPGLFIGTAVVCLFCNAISTGFASFFLWGLPLGMLAIFLTPMILGINSARFVAHHAGNPDFDLVLLTHVTDTQIVGGYWETITHRLRWNGVALAPLFPYGLMCIGGFLSLIFLGTGEFPVFIMLIVGSYLGWYWSSQMLGLTLGLALRQQRVITEVSVGMMLFLTGLWGWGLLVVIRILGNWFFQIDGMGYRIAEWQLALIIFWFIAPFAIGLMASRLALYFVRNPIST